MLITGARAQAIAISRAFSCGDFTQDTDNGTSPTLPPNPKEKKMMTETEYNQKWYRQPPHHWVKLAVAILLGLLGAVGVIALMQP